MPRNGSGTYALPSGNPVVTGTTINSTTQNNTMSDIATALTNSLAKDGQTTPTANLPMGGYKLTGLAAGSARTDSASISNIQDGTGVYVGTVGGTGNAITLTPSPAISSYAAGQTFSFIASASNTGATTVNISGLGLKDITKEGATALIANDIVSGSVVWITYDGTRFQIGSPQADVSKSEGDSFYGPSFGLTLSNNVSDATNDIDIAAGARWDSGRTARMVLAAGVTRQLDVAFGSGNGGRFDTSIADGTWHVFLISNGTLVNVGLSQSLNPTGTANYPSGYTLYRRIGSILRESGAIVGFSQLRDEFLRTSAVLDVNVTNPGTSDALRTLSVINGVKVYAIFNLFSTSGAGVASLVLVTEPDFTDVAASASAAPLANSGSNNSSSSAASRQVIRTNTSRQIRTRNVDSDANSIIRIATIGWRDTEIMEP